MMLRVVLLASVDPFAIYFRAEEEATLRMATHALLWQRIRWMERLITGVQSR